MAICCFAVLLLSTSSLSYFYWLQEKVHEHARFTSIDAGRSFENADYIELLLQNKSVLPEGYHWEEAGREFSYKGMFYDIVSIKKTSKGWVIKAVSDEAEAAILADQHKVHSYNKNPNSKTSSDSTKIKLNLSFALYDRNDAFDFKHPVIIPDKKDFLYYTTPILNCDSGVITPPPKAV
jgi:hypothetical protein